MIGIFCKTNDLAIIMSAALGGADFVIIDREHGNASWDFIRVVSHSMKPYDCKIIVRVESNDSHLIGKALDNGADGVQVPHIETEIDAVKAVSSGKFSPLGNRGVCRFVSAADYGNMERNIFFQGANNTWIVLQIEGQEGIANFGRIAVLDGVDILFIGPYDLSASLGLIGQVRHVLVNRKIEELASIAKSSGKKLGIFVDSEDDMLHYKSLGFEYIAYSVDLNIFGEAVKEIKYAYDKE